MLLRFLAAGACFLLVTASSATGQPGAIVGLYVTDQSGRSLTGTGFFTSPSGEITTAYHLIHQAGKLKAIGPDGATYRQLRITRIAPDRDLAVLQIAGNPATPSFIRLIDRVPGPGEELTIIGYPKGLPNQFIRARPTSETLISSWALQNGRGQRLFRAQLDILPLDATVYSGMSGAPIIARDGVLGILSGSYDEGGTIAWMIPSKHARDLQPFNRAPEQVVEWPRFDLMAPAFKGLGRSTRVHPGGEQLLEAFLDSVEQYAQAGAQIGTTAAKLVAQIQILRPFLQTMASDPSLAADPKTAMSFLDPPLESMLAALEPYGQSQTRYAELSQEVGNRGTDLTEWAKGLARTDPEARKQLLSIDSRFSSLDTGGYYQRIGADPQAFMRSVADFGRVGASLQGNSPDDFKRFASGMLNLIAGLERDAKTHASPNSMATMRSGMMNFRTFASAFEPLVYGG